MIQVHNLKKKFDDFQALNGVEMHVGKGDLHSFPTRRSSDLSRKVYVDPPSYRSL